MLDVRCWMFDVGPLFPSAVALAPRPEPGITNPTNYAENKLNSDDAKSRRRKENWRRLLPRITRITRMETDNEQEQEATEETESRAISRKLYQKQPLLGPIRLPFCVYRRSPWLVRIFLSIFAPWLFVSRSSRFNVGRWTFSSPRFPLHLARPQLRSPCFPISPLQSSDVSLGPLAVLPRNCPYSRIGIQPRYENRAVSALLISIR